MRKLYSLSLLILLSGFAFKASAQSGFSDVIKVSPGDATKLIDAYGKPMFKSFGAGMNGGWTNTAKTKKFLHFDLRFSSSLAFTPQSDKSFDVTKLGLSNGVTPANPNSTITPTLTGARTGGVVLNINDANGTKVSSFTMPSGQISSIPAPQVQLTIGLPANTDLIFRAIPNINAGSVGSVNMVGFGLKHNIMQDIFGPAKKLVPFDLSILLAYSSMNLRYNLNVQPDAGSTGPSADFNDQYTRGHFTSFVGELLASKQLGPFTPFVGVGFNTAHTKVNAIGDYPAASSVNVNGQETYTVYTNPVNISESSLSGARADIGFQLAFGFFRFYASASAAQYTSINGGIGFDF